MTIKSNISDPMTGFSVNYLQNDSWSEKGLRSFLEYRDLGVTKATGGHLRAEHIRVKGSVGGTGWHYHELDFQFVYILRGQVKFVAEDRGEEIILQAHDCAHLPPRMSHDETGFSRDFEVLEITMPAEVATVRGKAVDRSRESWSRLVINHLAPTDFVPGRGLRSFLEYRDLGISEATERRVEVQVVRTGKPADERTGWHYHTLRHQFVFILNGWVRAVLNGYGEFTLKKGDSMTIPSHLKHGVTAFSADFEVLELNVPADFDTVPASP